MDSLLALLSCLLVGCCLLILTYAKIGNMAKQMFLLAGCLFLILSAEYFTRSGREIQLSELLSGVDFSQLSGANVLTAKIQINIQYGQPISVKLLPDSTEEFKPPHKKGI